MAENKYMRWLAYKTASIYWHDSIIIEELDEAIENGAIGQTTNPFLVAAGLKAQPAFWRSVLPGMPESIQGDARAEEWIAQVAAWFAKNKLAQFKGRGKFAGYVCAQTNPCKPGDVEATIATAKHYASMADPDNKNIVAKIPVTRAGLEAMEACAAEGINVVGTVSGTVSQALAMAEAYQRGRDKAIKNGIEPGIGIAVLMIGRLDDYLRDVMNDTQAAASESDIKWAGISVFKRAYNLFKEKNYDCVLMPAGSRGSYHIKEISGADMVMSIAPFIAKALIDETDFSERINIPVEPDILSRLCSIPEFVKAYEPYGMSVKDFITYGFCNRTLDQYVQLGWNLLANTYL